MALQHCAKFVGKRVFHGVDKVVESLDALDRNSVGRRNEFGLVKGNFVDDGVDGHRLHPFGTEPRHENDAEPAAVFVLGFYLACAFEGEAHMVAEVYRCCSFERFEGVSERLLFGKQVDVPGGASVYRPCQHALTALEDEFSVGIRENAAEQPVEVEAGNSASRIERRILGRSFYCHLERIGGSVFHARLPLTPGRAGYRAAPTRLDCASYPAGFR